VAALRSGPTVGTGHGGASTPAGLKDPAVRPQRGCDASLTAQSDLAWCYVDPPRARSVLEYAEKWRADRCTRQTAPKLRPIYVLHAYHPGPTAIGAIRRARSRRGQGPEHGARPCLGRARLPMGVDHLFSLPCRRLIAFIALHTGIACASGRH